MLSYARWTICGLAREVVSLPNVVRGKWPLIIGGIMNYSPSGYMNELHLSSAEYLNLRNSYLLLLHQEEKGQ